MKTPIKKIEKLIAMANAGSDIFLYAQSAKIDMSLYYAYRKSNNIGNELIDFNDVIWDTSVCRIADTLKENGIKEFTISSEMSGVIKAVAAFEKEGFVVAGTTTVKTPYKDFVNGGYLTAPAFRMIAK